MIAENDFKNIEEIRKALSFCPKQIIGSLIIENWQKGYESNFSKMLERRNITLSILLLLVDVLPDDQTMHPAKKFTSMNL